MKKLLTVLFIIMSTGCLINNFYWLSKDFSDVKSLVWGFVIAVLFALAAVIVNFGEQWFDKIDDYLFKRFFKGDK